jgi:phosphopantothenoylcysteine decarboxylase/phosphopantothenate--cysteine ligase
MAGKRVLLGVTGGIAAYKAPDLVRRLRERGADVRVVMTASATRFVTPLTFQAVSGHPVRTDLWDPAAEASMGHIELARWADVVVVAPATADFLARLAGGHADDLLTTLCLATAAPVHAAPAMNRQMWANAATGANVATLAGRGIVLHGPASGDQACGETGEGRMLEPLEIVAALEAAAPAGPLAGRRLVVTAGPTREPLDPVRYLTNRSSGKMGYAVAAAAARAGADVTLVSGPVAIDPPADVATVQVETAGQMLEAVMGVIEGADAFVAAAAVADYRPVSAADRKIKKGEQDGSLELVLNPDILAQVAALPRRPLVVGFAAETDEVEANARKKLETKRLDLIAANRVGADCGFDADHNALVVLTPRERIDLGSGSKAELAGRLVTLIAERLGR